MMKFDVRWLYVLLAISMIIPLIRPMGLPLYITERTRRAYQFVQNLPEGSHVLLSTTINPDIFPELKGQVSVLFNHLFKKRLQFIWICEDGRSPPLVVPMINDIMKKYPDRVHGKDFVLIGYIPGVETGLAAFGRDTSFSKVDMYGKPLSDHPLMKEIRTATDFQLVIALVQSDVERYLRQFQAPYKLPIIQGAISTVAASMGPYYMSGQLTGVIYGLPGTAEYEMLLGMPGYGVTNVDALSSSHLLCIVVIVCVNVSYLYHKRRKN